MQNTVDPGAESPISSAPSQSNAPAAASAPPRTLPRVNQPPPASRPGAPPIEIGGPPGPEPTRYGDWEKNGRCIDF